MSDFKLTREVQILDHSPMKLVNGFPLPFCGFKESNMNEIAVMKPRDDDVFINTFPKCGTTWAQYIVWSIMNDGALPPDTFMKMLTKAIPFLELTGTDMIEMMPSPRVFKLHLPYRLTPQSSKAKYLIIARNPFDACVSYFNHLNEIDLRVLNVNVAFDTYVLDFITGEVPFGSFFEFVTSWYEHRNDPNVHYMYFEDMKKDPKATVFEIAEFLGSEHKKKLEDNPHILEAVLKHTSFDFMKKHVEVKIERTPEMMDELKHLPGFDEFVQYDTLDVNFFREGAVGGSKTFLSKEQWKTLEQAIEERVKDPNLRKMLTRTKIVIK